MTLNDIYKERKRKIMRTKETTKQKIEKYEKWITTPKYIEQELKGERLLSKIKEPQTQNEMWDEWWNQ